MKKLITLILSLAIFGIANATDVSGIISANTTWNSAGSPYIVTGDITVNNGITLTVDPTVEVKFDSGRKMYIYGTISASSATFTSNQAVPAPGDWQFIQIGNTSYSGVASLTSCVMQYAQKFYIYNGTATLTNTNIEFFYYYGIEVNDVLNMTGGLIDLSGYFSSYGYGLYAKDGSVCSLNNVSIINGKYGINMTTSSQVDLTDCTVTSNVWPVYFGGPGDLSINGTCDFSGNTRDALYVYASVMSKNWTLPFVNVPYYFSASFTVNNTYTLTIASENIIKFPIHTGLIISGKLVANAGVGKNIFFTSERDDNWGGDTNNDGSTTAPAVSDWYGIRFYDESDNSSVMRRCKLRYAGFNSIGGISLYDAGPTIDLCELQQNYFGAYFQNASTPTFTNNTIGSSSKTPIAMSFEANPVFTNNILSFMDNEYDAIGLLGGTLTANAHIIKRNFTTVSNITYVMLAQITVPLGFTLTIDPGIVIKSPSYMYRIIIKGKLVCDGTVSQGITFTSVKDDNFGNPNDTNKDGTNTTPVINDMGAIIFEDGHDPTSIIDNVLMKYASVYSYYYVNGGSNHYLNACAIATISSLSTPAGPTISNCEFRELNYGISCYQASNPVISNNNMINISNTPFSIAASATPTFSGNTFTNVGINALGLIGHNVINNGTLSKRDIAGFTNITYVLLEDLTVMNSTYLNVESGIVIKMWDKRWYIDGGFKTDGTFSEHVIFTSLNDDNVGNPMDTNGDGSASSPAAGNWDFVEFRDSSDDIYCTLDYTDFLYGGGGGSSYGMVRWTNAGADINYSLIDRSSSFGMWINGNSDPIIENVAIQNCSSDPIAMSLTANPTFTNITFTANLSNGIFLIEGLPGYSLSTNETLIKRSLAGFSNIAYIIDDLTITSNAVLTVEEGIVFKFRGQYFVGIYNHGGLNATGLVGEKIIFTSIKDDSAGGDTNNDGSNTTPANNDWDGILYYETGDDTQNKLIYCELRYTGGGYDSPWGSGSYLGAARVKDAKVTIDHTIFQQGNGSAVGIYGSAYPEITNCEMYNITGEPIFMAMFSNPTFSNNTVANIGRLAIGIQPETYSQTATVPQRNFAGYTNITYMLYNSTINSGTTITIPAGTVFKSMSNYLTINGKLEVAGTTADSVVFTDYRDDAYGNPADTEQNGTATSPTNYGLYFVFNDVSDDASYINNTIMRYSTDVIRLNSASPTITNNTFYKVDHGITNSGVCTPAVVNNTFDDLEYGPMRISLVSYPAVTSGNVISGSTYKAIGVNSETLTQDVTLPKRSFGGVQNIPYFFSNYTIGTGVTLTIDPGVICKFSNYGSMVVNNGLIAEGTATSGGHIVFTSLTDDFYGGDSNSDGTATSYGSVTWYGITINDVAIDDDTRFANCIFRWAKYGTGYGIRTISSKPSVLNCSFNNCNYGVYATAASQPTINYCDFYDITTMAVNNVNQSYEINAKNCWWGDNSGPTHSGNPGGTGETVSDEVDYDPFGTNGAINPLLGDVSLNSIVQAYDASLVLQHVATLIILNPTQQVVADVSGNGSILAYDASLILQYVVGLINYFPATLLNPLPAFVSDVELMVGNTEVNPGDEFALPISISNVSGLYAMEMTISYNPEIINATDVVCLIPGMNVSFKINQEAGTIKIAFAGIESLEYDMDAANIVFKVNDGVTNITTPVSAKYFMANETDLSWNVTDGSVSIKGFTTGVNNIINENKMLSCYPNPFTKNLNITYTVVNENENIYIAIYNIYGEKVDEIAKGKHSATTYSIVWNGKNTKGTILPNGTYFIRMIAGSNIESQKIQIVR